MMHHMLTERLLSTRMRRRGLIIGAGALTAWAAANQWPQRVLAQPKFLDYPFKLGVASGDPLPDSVVIWTRLAPDPLNGGGMRDQSFPVQWQVAEDEGMRRVVQRGNVVTTPDLGHSIHVEVGGLQPNRWYWYQFKAGSEVSPIGRTKTAPAPGDSLNQFRFAFASCQNWPAGYYAAYQDMARQDLDLVIHVGDYIYEGTLRNSGVRSEVVPEPTRPEPVTLEQYRNRHGLYKLDSNLQAAHAAFPWLVTWDDHEVDNNWADEIPQDPELQSREAFLARRAAAFQAYYEHMPLRRVSIPQGIDMQLYQRYTFGDLIEFNVLDTRQYRSDQVEGRFIAPRDPDSLNPSLTMTGTEQEQWLFQNLDRSRVRWNVLAQQTIMAEYDYDTGPGETINHDQWDGYVAARDRIFNFIRNRRPSNPVVITGDWHSSWVNDLKTNFDDPNSETIATEFVGTSISSGCPWAPQVAAALSANPHVKFFDGDRRGYVSCTINQQRWLSDYRTVDNPADPNSPVRTLASFMVENGRPGAQRL